MHFNRLAMRPNLQLYLVVGMFAVFLGCAGPKKTTTTSTGGIKYSEDLSVLRPKTTTSSDVDTNPTVDKDIKKQTALVEPKYAVTKKLDAVLDTIDAINVRRNFIDGFTIQVYSGLKREEALNAKKTLTSSLPDLESEIHYAQPNFRVKVGKYYYRLDAQKDYVEVKKYFPTAIVIPDKVAIN